MGRPKEGKRTIEELFYYENSGGINWLRLEAWQARQKGQELVVGG